MPGWACRPRGCQVWRAADSSDTNFHNLELVYTQLFLFFFIYPLVSTGLEYKNLAFLN